MNASLACLPLALVSVLLPCPPSSGPSLDLAGDTLLLTDDDPPFPGEVAITQPTAREALAMGLSAVADGSFERGLDGMRKAAEGLEDPLAPRLERAIVRTEALIAVRDGWVAALGEKGGKVKVPVDGKLKTAVVKDVRDGEIRFTRSVGKRNGLRLDELDAALLAANVGKDVGSYGEPWTRGWAYLLGGNEKWDKFLKGDEEAVAAIEADAADVPALLTEGRGLLAIQRLAVSAPATDVATAEALLAAVEGVLAHARGVDAYLEREDDVRELARSALAVQASALDVDALLAGKVTDLGGGRVRVEYTFDDATELGDFEVVPGMMGERFPQMDTGVPEDESSVTADKGRLAFLGQVGILHQLQFAGPTNAEFDVQYTDELGGGAVVPSVHMGFGTTADANLRCALLDFQGSEAITLAGSVYFYAKEPRPIEAGASLSGKLEATADGRLVATVAETEIDPLSDIGEVHGAAFVAMKAAQANWLERLVIEGAPMPDSIRDLRQHWVARRLLGMAW